MKYNVMKLEGLVHKQFGPNVGIKIAVENKIYNEIENGHFESSKHNKFQNTE